MSSQQSTSQMVVAEQQSEPKKNITIKNSNKERNNELDELELLIKSTHQ